MYHIVVVEKAVADKITISVKELQNLMNDAYEEGKKEVYKKWHDYNYSKRIKSNEKENHNAQETLESIRKAIDKYNVEG